MMNIIVKNVGEPHEIREFDNLELENEQEIVGGYIENLYVGNGVDMWFNEDGKVHGLPTNIALGSQDKRVLDLICGNIYFASVDADGRTIGLTDKQIEWVEDKLDSDLFITQFERNHLEFLPVWIYEN